MVKPGQITPIRVKRLQARDLRSGFLTGSPIRNPVSKEYTGSKPVLCIFLHFFSAHI